MSAKTKFVITCLADFEQYSKHARRGDIRDSLYWQRKRAYIRTVLGYRCVDCRTTLGVLHVDCIDGNHESTEISNFAVVCDGCNKRRAVERGELVTRPELSPERRAKVRLATRRYRERLRART